MGFRKAPNVMVKQSVQPKDEEQASSLQGGGSAQKKRKCIPTACEQCRKRKSRCDGQKPDCSACRFVYKTSCSFNETESAATTPTKQHESAAACASSDHEVIKILLRAPAPQVPELVSRLRDLGDAAAFVDELQKRRSPTPTSESSDPPKPSHDRLGNISGEPMIMDLRTMRDLNSHGNQRARPASTKQQRRRNPLSDERSWTTVVKDKELVAHLIKLYFTWNDPFYMCLSKRHFLRDFVAGPGSTESKFCSKLLVNAICAFGCLYSDRSDLPQGADDLECKGKLFMDEAKQLLENDMASAHLTTVQALAVMTMWEISTGHIERGSLYTAMCMRMVIDTNMNREDQGYKNMDLDQKEVTQLTFWGCFNVDSAWSKFVARTPSISMNEIILDNVANNPLKQTIREDQVSRWLSYTDDSDPDTTPDVDQDLSLFQQYTALSKIINAMAHSYYASGQNVNSTKLLEYHGMYLQWFKQLPRHLHYRPDAAPPIMCLHVYYSSCIIHLFMPLSRHKIVNSKVIPRNVCTEHAYRITDITRDYQRNWGTRHTFLPMTHILMVALYIYIDNWPREIAREKLSQSLNDLIAMGPSHGWAKRCVNMIVNWAADQGKDIFEVPPPPAFPQLKGSATSSSISSKPGVSQALSIASTATQADDRARSISSVDLPGNNQTAHLTVKSDITTSSQPSTPSSATLGQQSYAPGPGPLSEEFQGAQDQLYLAFPGGNMPLQHSNPPSQQMPMDLPKIMNGFWGHLGYLPLEEWNENMVDGKAQEDLRLATFPNTNETFTGQDVDGLQNPSGFRSYHPAEEQQRGVYEDHGSMPGQHTSHTAYTNLLGGYGPVQAHHHLHGSMYNFSHGDGMQAGLPEQPNPHGPGRPVHSRDAYQEWNSQQ